MKKLFFLVLALLTVAISYSQINIPPFGGRGSQPYPLYIAGGVFVIPPTNTFTPTFTPTGSATPTPTPTPTVTPTLTPVVLKQPVTVVGNFAYQSAPVAPSVVLVGGQSPANNNIQPIPLDTGGNYVQVLSTQASAPYSITNQGSLFSPSIFSSVTTGTPIAFTQGGLYWGWHVTLGNANPVTCGLDGSFDGANYDVPIGTQTLTGSGGQTFAPACVPYVRPKVTGWTISGTPTVTIQVWGRQ